MTDRTGVRAQLESLLAVALQSVEAGARVKDAAPSLPETPWVVLAVGKAAAAMAGALEELAPERIARGLVVTKDGHGLPLARSELREAGHPVPDTRSELAGHAALELAASTREDETLVVLLSGGASALLTCPQAGLSLRDLAQTTEQLLAAGADIHELNAVRKHLGAVGGGRLARAASGQVELLAISDVPGDRLDVIGSGPCSPDSTRFADALDVVENYKLASELPGAVLEHLRAGARGEREENPAPGDAVFEAVQTRILAGNADALAAAQRAASEGGLHARLAAEPLEGEAREVAAPLIAAARGAARRASQPTLWLAGGETTVTLRGAGKGGRNQELALAGAVALDGSSDASLLAVGTDGTDGPTDAAGAFVDGETVARGAAQGLDASAALDDNDSYSFFVAEGGLVRTGPTQTNVMDLAFVHVAPGARGS